MLRFQFLLDDLSAQTDADLRARSRMTAGGRVAILALKHGRDQVAVRIRGPAELDVWFGRVLTASSLDDVLGATVAVPPNKTMRAQPRSVRRRPHG